MNILLLTSCNRIKQLLLSLSLNDQIIKEKFSVVIIDSSTPNIDSKLICEKLDSEDPYNIVKPDNYCSDVNLLYDSHKYFKNIEEFKVIHFEPRLRKQEGESTSVALGLMQSALIGNRYNNNQNYCLKITGSSILKYDILSELTVKLKDNDVITWHRQNIGGEERSTRIFGCNPNILSSLISNEKWSNWCDDVNGVFELRFAKFINKNIPNRIFYTNNDESSVLLEGGSAMNKLYAREIISNFIEKNSINIELTPYLKEFSEGGIW